MIIPLRKKTLPDSPSLRMVSAPLLALIFTSWKMLGRLNSCRLPWRSTALLSLVAGSRTGRAGRAAP